MDLKPTNIILLIDFEGHPALGSEFTNNQRFSTLNWLLNPIKEEPIVIISTHLPDRDKKTEEMAKMVRVEGRHKWKNIDPDNSNIESIKVEVKKMGYTINKVIIGGTNTSGCVFRHKNYCAINWAKRGYHVQVAAEMVADYQMPGTNGEERNQHALAIVWRDVAKAKVFDLITYVRNVNIDV
jgi:hypothetical protein|tara:strand:- start:1597 stop:2142 length:546 start_codon:yes stop_codon:yes gene_type:complete